VQNAGEAGVEREEAQGKRLATLAREAGVEHFVYTSVGSAHKQTGVATLALSLRCHRQMSCLNNVMK
jgi:hypothetical protein